jgi:hypothetical protein
MVIDSQQVTDTRRSRKAVGFDVCRVDIDPILIYGRDRVYGRVVHIVKIFEGHV